MSTGRKKYDFPICDICGKLAMPQQIGPHVGIVCPTDGLIVEFTWKQLDLEELASYIPDPKGGKS